MFKHYRDVPASNLITCPWCDMVHRNDIKCHDYEKISMLELNMILGDILMRQRAIRPEHFGVNKD